MLKVIGCFTQEHNHWLVALAALICLSGSALTLRMFSRLRNAPKDRRLMHVLLTGVIGGATIWTTHFVAMIAYDPPVVHAFEPALTGLSLLVAMVGVTAGLGLAASTQTGRAIEAGGAVVGLSIASMHYVGMSAYMLPGRITWDPQIVAASVIFGVVFGALALNRVTRTRTRYCFAGGVATLTLAICLMHFTGMGAATIELNPTVFVAGQSLSDETLTVLVVGVMSLIMLIGLAASLIEAKLEEQAGADYQRATLHDPLTDLPNRAHLNLFLQQFDEAIAGGDDVRIAIVAININRFKEINDLHGYGVGDSVLKAISKQISYGLNDNEFIARTGGDEFIAVKYDYERMSSIKAFADRLAGRVAEPIHVGYKQLTIGASIGVAAFPEHGETIDTLVHNATLAMNRAKSGRLEAVCFFDEEADRQNRDRIEMAQDLRQALADEQFELNFQLQNDVRTREPLGFEALLRWNHPNRGRIPPNLFIPIAESTGLIRSIGVWVLHTACREAASWETPLRIAVNVAPQQLSQPSFVDHVANALERSGLDPKRLELEITEASIIDDHKNALEIMQRLKAMGVRIAMDDFGTGYSSLALLRTFPFDKIKIDRSFIDSVHENVQSAAIVRSTLLLGAALHIPVLAEGVENEEELDFLNAEDCAEVQGFYFGKPMSAAEARAIASPSASKSKGGRAA